MKSWLPALSLVLLTGIVFMILASTAAHAQGGPAETVIISKTADAFLERGILGLLVVAEGIVIYFMYRDLKAANATMVSWATSSTKVIADSSAVSAKCEEALTATTNAIVGLGPIGSILTKNTEQLIRTDEREKQTQTALARAVERLDKQG